MFLFYFTVSIFDFSLDFLKKARLQNFLSMTNFIPFPIFPKIIAFLSLVQMLFKFVSMSLI